MSSIVCQGLQSCLETSLIEPLVLRHKLAQPESNSPQMYHHHHALDLQETADKNGSLGGWSFIKSTTNNPEHHHEEEGTYVHPLVKLSSSKLSKKSLEMCTESLGSETGSDTSDDLSPPLPPPAVNRSKPRQFARKLTNSCSASFPPPLTSISGSGGGGGVRVRPYREHGRLVLKAETVASNGSYLQAERVDGRLRLCMTIACPINNGDCDEVVVDEPLVAQERNGNDLCLDDKNDDQNRVGVVVRINGNSGSEFETGEFATRPRRCKEGSGRGRKGLQSWGAVWVASS